MTTQSSNTQVQRLQAAAPFSDSTQIERIRKAVIRGKTSIAFFCPGKSFRKQFGTIPALLETRGHTVL